MAKITLAKKEIEIDDNGFIQEIEKWDEAVAQDLAKLEGITEMNADHWKVITFLRDYFIENRIAPPIRMLVKKTGCDLQYIYQLFPSGPIKGACKVAGLPKPDGCV
jgi:dissimilatory sulfite reductase related protein